MNFAIEIDEFLVVEIVDLCRVLYPDGLLDVVDGVHSIF